MLSDHAWYPWAERKSSTLSLIFGAFPLRILKFSNSQIGAPPTENGAALAAERTDPTPRQRFAVQPCGIPVQLYRLQWPIVLDRNSSAPQGGRAETTLSFLVAALLA